mgnify:CR=1 FL=1
MAQAFATAGKEFEVISNDYKIPVVVPYNDEAKKSDCSICRSRW